MIEIELLPTVGGRRQLKAGDVLLLLLRTFGEIGSTSVARKNLTASRYALNAMIKTTDIYWIAGLLEGEGCFQSSRKEFCSPTITLLMSDADTVQRAHDILKSEGSKRSILLYNDRRPNRKPFAICKIGGRHAAGWMMTLYPLMGQRRQRRIRELLTAWTNRA